MREELISFETANLAKQKGFGKTLYHIYPNSYKTVSSTEHVLVLNSQNNTKEDFISAPTQSQLQRWLREDCKIIVDVSIHGTSGDKASFGYCIQWYNKRWFHKGNELEIHWDTYEDALERAMQVALELIKPNNLIDKK